jgi:hypothetical protein
MKVIVELEMNQIQQSVVFFTEHINQTFEMINIIDESSMFENDNGVLVVQEGSATYTYNINNGRIVYNDSIDDYYLTDASVVVDRFFIEKYEVDGDVMGVRITTKMHSEKDIHIESSNTTLFKIN